MTDEEVQLYTELRRMRGVHLERGHRQLAQLCLLLAAELRFHTRPAAEIRTWIELLTPTAPTGA